MSVLISLCNRNGELVIPTPTVLVDVVPRIGETVNFYSNGEYKSVQVLKVTHDVSREQDDRGSRPRCGSDARVYVFLDFDI